MLQKGSRDLRTKKEVKNDLFSCLAPLTVESCNLLFSFGTENHSFTKTICPFLK
jgi:hypothetical protein